MLLRLPLRPGACKWGIGPLLLWHAADLHGVCAASASEAALEAAEEEEAERVEAAVAVVAEMQLTAEQLRVRASLPWGATLIHQPYNLLQACSSWQDSSVRGRRAQLALILGHLAHGGRTCGAFGGLTVGGAGAERPAGPAGAELRVRGRVWGGGGRGG